MRRRRAGHEPVPRRTEETPWGGVVTWRLYCARARRAEGGDMYGHSPGKDAYFARLRRIEGQVPQARLPSWSPATRG